MTLTVDAPISNFMAIWKNGPFLNLTWKIGELFQKTYYVGLYILYRLIIRYAHTPIFIFCGFWSLYDFSRDFNEKIRILQGGLSCFGELCTW